LEKLFPGVLKGRVDGIDSGQWQTLTPLADLPAQRKYLEAVARAIPSVFRRVCNFAHFFVFPDAILSPVPYRSENNAHVYS
jgi:hypothetical protein